MVVLRIHNVICKDKSNDGETLSAPNWNLKYGNSSVEEKLTDESDISENEKANDTLLSYFKKMDLNLKPETIETVEEFFTEEPSEVFPYADFLPPPFSTLDLHKLVPSKSENWKATMGPAEGSKEHDNSFNGNGKITAYDYAKREAKTAKYLLYSSSYRGTLFLQSSTQN
ncbi:Protein FAM217A [Manis javanica]|nr:Protein FAM217A [Manis javanica]